MPELLRINIFFTFILYSLIIRTDKQASVGIELTEVQTTTSPESCPIAAAKKAEEARKAQQQTGPNPLNNLKNESLFHIIYVLSTLLVALIVVPVVVSLNGQSDDSTFTKSYYWTKHGLEKIPHMYWSKFSTELKEEIYLPYIAHFPFPHDQDEITDEHLEAWISVIWPSSIDELLEHGVISTEMVALDDSMIYRSVSFCNSAQENLIF